MPNTIFVVENKTGNPINCEIGCRSRGEVIFAVQESIKPGEKWSYNHQVKNHFEFAVSVNTGQSNAVSYGRQDNIEEITAIVQDKGVFFSVSKETNKKVIPNSDKAAANLQNHASGSSGLSRDETTSLNPNTSQSAKARQERKQGNDDNTVTPEEGKFLIDRYGYKFAGISIGAGLIATLIPSILDLRPSVTVLIGSIVVAGVLLKDEPIRPYAISGTLFLLILSGVVLLPLYPETYGEQLTVPLLIVGVLSLLGLLLREGLRILIKFVVTEAVDDETTGDKVGQTIASIVGTIVVAYAIIKTKERIARAGSAGALGSVTFVADLLGINLPMPFLEIDLNLFLFIGAIAVGFHSIASWHAAWQLKDNKYVRSAGSKAKNTAVETQETLAATLNDAHQEISK